MIVGNKKHTIHHYVLPFISLLTVIAQMLKCSEMQCPIPIISTHCNCPATVHLTYTMKNCSVQLKNSFIQPKFKMFIRIVPKVPSLTSLYTPMAR